MQSHEDESVDASPPPAHRLHRARWVVGGVVLLAAVAAGVVVALFLSREEPEAKDVDEAVDDYRSTSVPTAPSGVQRPDAGVYLSEGEGREELSFPPIGQDDGERMPLTISHLPEGCWRQTIDFNEAHWQRWDYCADGGRIVEQGGRTFQRWDLGATELESTADFVCDPPNLVFDPDAEAGDSWDQSCTGTNTAIEGSTQTEGTYTYMGPDELDLGGEEVGVHHYRQEHMITGAQTGTNRVDYWFDDTGLPIRMERITEVATDSPVGPITYDESGFWQLISLTPVD